MFFLKSYIGLFDFRLSSPISDLYILFFISSSLSGRPVSRWNILKENWWIIVISANVYSPLSLFWSLPAFFDLWIFEYWFRSTKNFFSLILAVTFTCSIGIYNSYLLLSIWWIVNSSRLGAMCFAVVLSSTSFLESLVLFCGSLYSQWIATNFQIWASADSYDLFWGRDNLKVCFLHFGQYHSVTYHIKDLLFFPKIVSHSLGQDVQVLFKNIKIFRRQLSA